MNPDFEAARKLSDAIELLRELQEDESTRTRHRALAITNIEQAHLWLVAYADWKSADGPDD